MYRTPGYMQGKNPEQENKRRLSAEKAYIDWTYSEGE